MYKNLFALFACLLSALFIYSGLGSGCAPDLVPNKEKTTTDAAAQPDGPPTEKKVIAGAKIETKDLGNRVTQVRVNSTDEKKWVYFSFSFGRDTQPKDPKNSKEWDIAFQRFKVKSNSGISGTGGVQVAVVEGQDFDSIRYAPRTGYTEDKADSDDEDKDPDYVFLGPKPWFIYNFKDHTLTPRKRVYILKSIEGDYFKIMFTKYYDKDGNSGFPTFKWAKIQAPKAEPPKGPKVVTKALGQGVTEVRINSAEQSKWIYYDFTSNAQVAVKDPKTSTAWALAFQRFQIKTNGGINGSRDIKVAILDKAEFDSVTKAPKDGYISDQPDGSDKDTEPDFAFLVQGGWFKYDPSTHTLAPQKRVYVLHVGDSYYKIVMTGYYNDKKQSGFPTFKWAKIPGPGDQPPPGPGKVITQDLGGGVTQVQVNSSDKAAWIYYDFASNKQVDVKDSKTSKDWALGFQRYTIRTNGGSNGSRDIKVAILDKTDFDSVKQAPKDGYVSDSTADANTDGKPDLVFFLPNTWYTYNPSNHTLAVKQRVYVFHIGSTYYKVAMTSYYNDKKQPGFPTFKWAKVTPPK